MHESKPLHREVGEDSDLEMFVRKRLNDSELWSESDRLNAIFAFQLHPNCRLEEFDLTDAQLIVYFRGNDDALLDREDVSYHTCGPASEDNPGNVHVEKTFELDNEEVRTLFEAGIFDPDSLKDRVEESLDHDRGDALAGLSQIDPSRT